jgi:hypothetical protein
MRKIPLTQGKFALVDDEDYGYLIQWRWQYYLTKGSSTGYASRGVQKDNVRKIIKMHRVILREINDLHIDHINGNGLDNRKSNLRYATRAQNRSNSMSNNKNGFKGVTKKIGRVSKPYCAQIRSNGKQYNLGYFKTPKEAHEAYKKAAIELHGEFAKW